MRVFCQQFDLLSSLRRKLIEMHVELSFSCQILGFQRLQNLAKQWKAFHRLILIISQLVVQFKLKQDFLNCLLRALLKDSLHVQEVLVYFS